MKFRHRIRAIIPVAVFVLLIPIKGQDAEVEEYDSRALSHYLDADLYMMQGDYEEAEAAYLRALQYDSSSATIFLGLGESLLKQGELKRSRQAGERAQQLQPEDPLVYEFLLRYAVAAEDTESALKYLDKWAQLEPSNLDPLFRKAGLLLQLNKFSEAIDTYLAIYDRDPLQEQVLPRAGEIALSTGDMERAYQAYKRLYRQRPDDPRINRTFAEIAVRTKRFGEAVEAYSRLESTGKASLATTLQLAWLHLQLKEPLKAQSLLVPLVEEGHRQWDVLSLAGHVADQLDDYEQLSAISGLMKEIYPDSVGGYTGLAIARNYLKDKSGAMEVLEEAVPLFPENPDIHYLLANLYFGAERYVKAEHHLLIALNHRPSASYIQHLLATTWSSLGKYTPSDSLYELVLKGNKGDATLMNNYAYSIAERSQASFRQLLYARRLSRKSLKLQPDNAAFLDTYGWIAYRMKWYRTAGRYITKSLEVRPDHPVVLEHLAEVYLKLGKPDQAEEYFKRAEHARQQESATVVRTTED
jgi:tetratricopeptide (TPR) repeat protein